MAATIAAMAQCVRYRFTCCFITDKTAMTSTLHQTLLLFKIFLWIAVLLSFLRVDIFPQFSG